MPGKHRFSVEAAAIPLRERRQVAESAVSRQDQWVFDGPNLLGVMDVECPVCGKVSRPEWRWLSFDGDNIARPARQEEHKYEVVGVEWMRCAHEDCEQLLIRVQESRVRGLIGGGGPSVATESWYARPSRPGQAVHGCAPRRRVASAARAILRGYLRAADDVCDEETPPRDGIPSA